MLWVSKPASPKELAKTASYWRIFSCLHHLTLGVTFDKELNIMRRSQNIVRHLFQMWVEMKTHFRSFKGVFLFSRAVNKVAWLIVKHRSPKHNIRVDIPSLGWAVHDMKLINIPASCINGPCIFHHIFQRFASWHRENRMFASLDCRQRNCSPYLVQRWILRVNAFCVCKFDQCG